MNILFSTRTSTSCVTVRGLSFHPNKAWILVGLDTGIIELWDYASKFVVHTFKAHDGPVQSVHFHISEPLFVSGGQDRKITVRNYELKEYSFTLLGHRGSVNSVQFHDKFTWILSASSDYTVKVWDRQSRQCIYNLKGHFDIVTSACFHCKELLILSASLDHTMCVWDMTSFGNNPTGQRNNNNESKWYDGIMRWLGVHVSKHVLRFYTGFVAAAFHPTRPFICSASTAGNVQTWSRTDANTWEELPVNMRGARRGDEISCVIFHAKKNIIVGGSVSSILVSDAEKRTRHIRSFQFNIGNIRVLASHPTKNMLAAGHGKGFFLFKLGRDRPAFGSNNDYLCYARDDSVYVFDWTSKKSTHLVQLFEPGTSSLYQAPKTIACSSNNKFVLICSEGEGGGGSYKLVQVPEDLGKTTKIEIMKKTDENSGIGVSAFFHGATRFVVLEKKSNYLMIKHVNSNNPASVVTLPYEVDSIFDAGKWCFLCRGKDRIFMWDVLLNKSVGDLQDIPRTRRVVWKDDLKYVALLGKDSVVVANRELEKQWEIREKCNVKSGVWWEDKEAFVYTTLEHLKVWVPNSGKVEILMPLELPLYLAKAVGDTIYTLNRDANVSWCTVSFSSQ